MTKESSEEMSSLAATILNMDPETEDGISAAQYNKLLKDAKRVAGSVLSQDETPLKFDNGTIPKFSAGDRIYIEKADKHGTIVRPYDYSGEWAYVILGDDGFEDEGWREDEITLENQNEASPTSSSSRL